MDRCQAGCISFTGGEKRHHKDCIYYSESLSKMYDDKDKRIKELEKQLFIAGDYIDELKKVLKELQGVD